MTGIPGEGLWKGSDAGVHFEVENIEGRKSRYKAVGKSERSHEGLGSAQINVVVHLVPPAGRHHVVVGSTRPY